MSSSKQQLSLQDRLLANNQLNQPSDPQAEQALIASLLTKPKSWEAVLNFKLTHEHFQIEDHQKIFNAAYSIFKVNTNPDLITLNHQLSKQYKKTQAEELFALTADILSNTPITDNANAYTIIIIEKYFLHQIAIAYAEHEAPAIIQAMQTTMDNILSPRPIDGRGDFTELATKEVTETQWVIQDILPVGISLMAAKAKSGKSYWVMQAALAISSGNPFLGQFQTTKGTVLQLALEDPEKRLVTRYQQLGAYPNGYWYTLESHFPRIGQGFEETVKEHLDKMPDCNLVIIDTLANVMPIDDTRSGDTYLKDYQTVTTIKSFASNYPNTAFIFLTHMKKGDVEDIDSILGSTAISGGFDNLYFLRKTGFNGKATMTMTGKDVAQETYALKFDKELTAWQYVGTGEMATMSDARLQVIEAMQDHGAETKQDIVQLTDLNDESTKRLLRRMKDDGVIEITGKKGQQYIYTLTDKFKNQETTSTDYVPNVPTIPTVPTVPTNVPTVETGQSLIVTCAQCGKTYPHTRETFQSNKGLYFCSHQCTTAWKYKDCNDSVDNK
ncbi:AAA family ATPase [Candidatus Albibeggiatoa sp. nov. BB20]|uniref:AAA family ATPase n=1 Tax=Candidatus Albibeggiatoa sp. nov. BB20 TaxID=3162723 RepID=UPI003365308F